MMSSIQQNKFNSFQIQQNKTNSTKSYQKDKNKSALSNGKTPK